MSFSRLQEQWFGNVRGDLLAGTVVALALIPEAIAFSIIAGVDPKVGLYASFCIAVVIAFVGGRPGMISAATDAMALVMVTLVRNHGLEYLLAATILTGCLQILAGVLRLGTLLRFVSRSVMTGFVNALAILIFMAQLPEFDGASWVVYAMVAAGLTIIYLFPYVTKAVPSPLIAIITLTAFSIYMGLDIRTVGDMGELPDAFPLFLLPNIPLTWETLAIIFPYAATLAVVGLLESLMTAVIVDDLTDTPSAKNQECRGQGIANIMAAQSTLRTKFRISWRWSRYFRRMAISAHTRSMGRSSLPRLTSSRQHDQQYAALLPDPGADVSLSLLSLPNLDKPEQKAQHRGRKGFTEDTEKSVVLRTFVFSVKSLRTLCYAFFCCLYKHFRRL